MTKTYRLSVNFTEAQREKLVRLAAMQMLAEGTDVNIVDIVRLAVDKLFAESFKVEEVGAAEK